MPLRRLLTVIATVVIVVASGAQAMAAEAPPAQLGVSADGSGFSTADGTPFFWLGDTAWSLLVNLDREQTVQYLDDRAEKGFTVIQAVAVAPPSGGLGPNAHGDTPYATSIDEPAVTAGDDPGDEQEYDYWDHVEFVVTEAAARGMYVALLPAWSSSTAGEELTAENAGAYGEFLGSRLGRRHANLIWMAGGDDNEGFHPEIWRELATGIAVGVTGTDDQGAILMGYHPGGGKNSASELDGERWLDFHSHQSGHGPIDGNSGVWDNIELSLGTGKPFLDSEPAYEEHPIDVDAANGYTTDRDVRHYAYMSVFSGAAGHTYGHHNIWMMYGTPRGGDGAAPKDIDWTAALDAPGAQQMAHFADLMAAHPIRRPDRTLITSDTYANSGDAVLALRAGDAVLVYSGGGREFTLDTASTSGARWFDPRTGRFSAAEADGSTFVPPSEEDWVLVLDGDSPNSPDVDRDPVDPQDVVFSADVETGDDSQFTGDEPQNVGAPAPEIVSDPELVRDGRYAVAFTVPGGGERSEFVPGVEVVEGDELWFSFSTLLADGFPVDSDEWQVIMQWHHDGRTGSPPLALEVAAGRYLISGGWGSGEEPWEVPIGPASTGVHVDWVFHVVFASDDNALIEVWQNGRKVIDAYRPPAGTLYDGQGNYLKIGYYRSGAIGQQGTVVHDNWIVGRTARSVGLPSSR